jgi:hypothetical protein
MAEAAAMAEAGAISPSPAGTTRSILTRRKRSFLDSFQFAFRSLESLESVFFFLHRATISNTDSAASPRGLPVLHDCLFLQRP